MASETRKRLFAALAGVLLLALAFVGIRAYQIAGPARGWVAAVVDRVPPDLPPGLDAAPVAVLLFSKTSGFRHEDAIPAANAALLRIAARNGWAVFATENAAVFNDAQLAHFDVVFGNNTTGDNWSEEQKQAFIRWAEGGGGFVGVHGAAGTRYRYWNWYTDVLLGGGRFTGHPMFPQFRKATVRVDDREHPTMRHFGPGFEHTDEWYSFEESAGKRGSHVLARLDEATYAPDDDLAMGDDHPIIWIACPGRGRSFYSALGHQGSTYALPDQERMLEEAVRWAADRNRSCP